MAGMFTIRSHLEDGDVDGLDARATAVTALPAQLAIVERHGRASSGAAALPFGIEALDQRLPSGGLLLGAMHEVQATGPDVETIAAPALFAAGVLARRSGPVIWIAGAAASSPTAWFNRAWILVASCSWTPLRCCC